MSAVSNLAWVDRLPGSKVVGNEFFNISVQHILQSEATTISIVFIHRNVLIE